MSNPITVSDHCLLRYLERVKGVDVETMRAEIARIAVLAVAMRAEKFGYQGFTYVLKGERVITVVPGSTPAASRRKSTNFNGRTVKTLNVRARP